MKSPEQLTNTSIAVCIFWSLSCSRKAVCMPWYHLHCDSRWTFWRFSFFTLHRTLVTRGRSNPFDQRASWAAESIVIDESLSAAVMVVAFYRSPLELNFDNRPSCIEIPLIESSDHFSIPKIRLLSPSSTHDNRCRNFPEENVLKMKTFHLMVYHFDIISIMVFMLAGNVAGYRVIIWSFSMSTCFLCFSSSWRLTFLGCPFWEKQALWGERRVR